MRRTQEEFLRLHAQSSLRKPNYAFKVLPKNCIYCNIHTQLIKHIQFTCKKLL